MPWYEFRCDAGHESERRMSMADETREIECPQCSSVAIRRMSAPSTRRVDAAKAAAIDATQRSAHEPAVVQSVPAAGKRRTTPVSHNPQHAKLPKP